MDKLLKEKLLNSDSKHPIDRFAYHLDTGLSERAFRETVAEMRNAGIRIVSSTKRDSKGYWLAHTEEEYLAYRREQVSRINNQARTIRLMDGNLSGQLIMEV